MSTLQKYKEYTGAQVNACLAALASTSDKPELFTLVRFTNKHENHNDFAYQTGLNTDTLAFRPQGQCSAGGLYFCIMQNAHHWIDYHQFARRVTLPDDARVYVEEHKMKADKFILGERTEIYRARWLFDGMRAAEKLHYCIFDESFYESREAFFEIMRKKKDAFQKTLGRMSGDFVKEPRWTMFDGALMLTAAKRGKLFQNVPANLLTRKLLEKSICSGQHSAGMLYAYFPHDLFDAEIKSMLVLAGAPVAGIAPALRTQTLFNKLISTSHVDELDLFDPAFFTQDAYNVLACNRHYSFDKIPSAARTQSILAALAACNDDFTYTLPNIVAQFDPSYFTQEICDKLATRCSQTIAHFPPRFCSHAQFMQHIMGGSLQNARKFPDEFFDDAAKDAIYKHLAQYTYRHDIKCLPPVALTRPMLDLYVAQKDWRAVRLFPDALFDTDLSTALTAAGYPPDWLPVAFQTREMWAAMVRANSVNIASAIPPAFRDAGMYELLVEHNANNIRAVPREMLSERMMLTALRRDHGHLRSIPPASRTPAVLQLIREQQAKPKRRHRRNFNRR